MKRLQRILEKFWCFLGAALLSTAADDRPPARSTEDAMEQLRIELEAEISRRDKQGGGDAG